MAEKEYIEREALMAEIHRIGGHNLCGWDTLGVKALVERQPTADVVEVRIFEEIDAFIKKRYVAAETLANDSDNEAYYAGCSDTYLRVGAYIRELKKKYTEGGAKMDGKGE